MDNLAQLFEHRRAELLNHIPSYRHSDGQVQFHQDDTDAGDEAAHGEGNVAKAGSTHDLSIADNS